MAGRVARALGAEPAEAAIPLPRRSRVVVVGSSGDRLWELAADVGADHLAVLPFRAGWPVVAAEHTVGFRFRRGARRAGAVNRAAGDVERGSATVLVLAGVMACCAVAGIWLASGRAALARQRAETAADLAALAGAQALERSEPSRRSAAGIAAAANSGRLVACSVTGDAVAVTVSVSRPMSAVAAARAAPQEPQ